MTKKEIINNLFEVMHKLEEFDANYSSGPAPSYMRYDKNALANALAKLKRRLETAQLAKEMGSTLLHVKVRLPDTVDKFIHDGQICQNLGVGFTEIGWACKSDFKKYPVVI